MNYKNIIFDLITWLEKHLDTPLSIETVAARAGYSKWHLQRLFKKITGYQLGTYIRNRRLSNAAVELRMTKISILDVALKYRFDSQQTFTRAFKKHFQQSPFQYRRSDEWDFSYLFPPLTKDSFLIIKPTFVTLPQLLVLGMPHLYTCRLDHIEQFDMAVRSNFWRRHFKTQPLSPGYYYGLNNITPSKNKKHYISIDYITSSNKFNRIPNDMNVIYITLNGGSYIQFDYDGPMEGLQQFIMSIYQHHLPQLKIGRRNGMDIERYYFFDEKEDSWENSNICCNYFIPCIKNDI